MVPEENFGGFFLVKQSSRARGNYELPHAVFFLYFFVRVQSTHKYEKRFILFTRRKVRTGMHAEVRFIHQQTNRAIIMTKQHPTGTD